MKAFEIS